MGIQQWSDTILVADLSDDPMFTDELDSLMDGLNGRPRDVVLDLAAVTFVNSSNLALLLRLRKYQRDHHRRLRLCGLREPVFQVLSVTGLDNLFDLSPELTTALAAMQTGAE